VAFEEAGMESLFGSLPPTGEAPPADWVQLAAATAARAGFVPEAI
jgi:hypothetical protein